MKFLWLTVFLFGAASVWSASDSSHRVLLRYEGPEADKYVPTLVSALAVQTTPLSAVVSLLPAGADAAEVSKEARRFACDLVLAVTVQVTNGRDQLRWALSSPVEEKPRAQGTLSKPRPQWSAAAETYWLFLNEPLAKETGPNARAWPQAPVSERGSVTVHARPGTLILGFASGPMTTDAEGSLSAEVDLPVSLALVGHLDGWQTEPVRVYVDHPGVTVDFVQNARARWALTGSLNNFAFPSVGLEWSPNDQRLFYRFAVDQYLIGVSLSTSRQPASVWGPLVSFPLVALSAGAGWRLSWPEDQIALSTSLDLAARIMFPSFRVLALEPIIPLTAQWTVAWEYRFGPTQSLYFETGPTLGWVTDSGSLKATGNSGDSDKSTLTIEVPGVPLVVWFPLQAKAGYRWAF